VNKPGSQGAIAVRRVLRRMVIRSKAKAKIKSKVKSQEPNPAFEGTRGYALACFL